MEEIWKPVVGYEDRYLVSNLGNVKSLYYNKLVKQTLTKHGYYTIGLYKHQKCFLTFVHRLVAQAFIPNPNNLPQINHKDEVKTNNIVTNLEWCDAKYNTNYGNCIKKRSEKQKGVSRYWLNKEILCYKDGVLVKEYNSLTEAANDIGCKINQISEHLKRPLRHKTVKGYVFKYKEVAD